MKKTFNAPELVELDFSETNNVPCGVKGRKIVSTSGPKVLEYSPNCFNVTRFFSNAGSFDDSLEVSYDFDENED